MSFIAGTEYLHTEATHSCVGLPELSHAMNVTGCDPKPPYPNQTWGAGLKRMGGFAEDRMQGDQAGLAGADTRTGMQINRNQLLPQAFSLCRATNALLGQAAPGDDSVTLTLSARDVDPSSVVQCSADGATGVNKVKYINYTAYMYMYAKGPWDDHIREEIPMDQNWRVLLDISSARHIHHPMSSKEKAAGKAVEISRSRRHCDLTQVELGTDTWLSITDGLIRAGQVMSHASTSRCTWYKYLGRYENIHVGIFKKSRIEKDAASEPP